MKQLYFALWAQKNIVKIGLSRNPQKRAEGLVASSKKARIVLLGVAPGTEQIETSIHNVLHWHRHSLEWFLYTKQVENFINWFLADPKYAVEAMSKIPSLDHRPKIPNPSKRHIRKADLNMTFCGCAPFIGPQDDTAKDCEKCRVSLAVYERENASELSGGYNEGVPKTTWGR